MAPDGISFRRARRSAALGIKPEDVTDVIISHVHWDHLDGIDLFPRARVWIQREEFDAPPRLHRRA